MIQIPYKVYTSALPENIIKHLLEQHEKTPKIKGEHFSGGTNANSIRDSEVTFLSSSTYNGLLVPFANDANSQARWGWNITLMEPVQISTYDVGQHYDWHIDGFLDEASARKQVSPGKVGGTDQTSHEGLSGTIRKISLVAQLSDPEDYEGGDLLIESPASDQDPVVLSEKAFRPKGSVIVFPSFLRHKVSPVTRGKRHSLTTWFGGPPYV